MSWLSIPLPNPFKSLQLSNNDDEEDDDKEEKEPQNNTVSSSSAIGRQFRALISPETSNSGDGGSPSSRALEGIRSDLEEFKGTFKSSLSIFSSSNAVSEISKLASNFLHFNDESDIHHVNKSRKNVVYDENDDEDDEGDDGDDDEGVGINDGVVEFAQQISNRPELWTEFPLSLAHEFDMSEAQYQHSLIIEQLVPSIADLRSNICNDKSENQFWMIYFILLLPRLNEDDLELLSTPEIVEARETLLKMLRAKKSEISSENPQSESSNDSDHEVHNTKMSSRPSLENVTSSENLNASTSIQSNETTNTKKLVESEDGNSKHSYAKSDNSSVSYRISEHGRGDNWEEEENIATRGTTSRAPKQFQSEDDVSFSDLDDDDCDLSNMQSTSGLSHATRTSSPEGSNDWVRLNKNVEAGARKVKSQSSLRGRDSEGEDSTGWLTVDDYDP